MQKRKTRKTSQTKPHKPIVLGKLEPEQLVEQHFSAPILPEHVAVLKEIPEPVLVVAVPLTAWEKFCEWVWGKAA